ncbi:MAG: hypothetical protein ABI333_09030 [bacterium]
MVLSILALFAGVLGYPVARRQPLLLAGLDGFVLLAVGGLVAVHLLPHSVHDAGLSAIAVAAVGFVFPSLIERWSARREGGRHRLLIIVVLIGLTVHALIDGSALSTPAHGGHGLALALAVLVHRLPIGLIVGNLLGREGELTRPLLAAGLIGILTTAGYFVGSAVLPHVQGTGLALFQAFVSGTLLHVIASHGPARADAPSRGLRIAAGLGAAVGVSGVIVVGMHEPSPVLWERPLWGGVVLAALLGLRFGHRLGIGWHHQEPNDAKDTPAPAADPDRPR